MTKNKKNYLAQKSLSPIPAKFRLAVNNRWPFIISNCVLSYTQNYINLIARATTTDCNDFRWVGSCTSK